MNGGRNRATWSKIRGLSQTVSGLRPYFSSRGLPISGFGLSWDKDDSVRGPLILSRSMITELKDLQGILGLSKGSAGLVLLLGQIFDAIFNIFIGAESDKISLIRGYGRRKGWHLIGSVFCVVSLAIFFTPPPMFVHNGTPGWVVLLYLVSCQLM